MPKFALYEIWTKCHVVEASSIDEVYDKGWDEADKCTDRSLNLANIHAYPVDDAARQVWEADQAEDEAKLA